MGIQHAQGCKFGVEITYPPRFGALKLNEITKSAIEIHLGKLADAGKGESTVEGVFVRLHSIMEEALDNDFIVKNPCRK